MEVDFEALQHLPVEDVGGRLGMQPRSRRDNAQSANAKPTAAVRNFTARSPVFLR